MAKYQTEVNSLLHRTIYYTPNALISRVDSGVYNFVCKIAEQYLHKFPKASHEFKQIIPKNCVFNYTELKKSYEVIKTKYSIPNISTERGANRIKSIEKYVLRNAPINPTCYLDIGCFDGSITSAIGQYFHLDKLQIHGVDIKSYEVSTLYNEFTFSQYDGCKLPYSDDSFDLITCLMVLHHISEENMPILLSEISRVMKPGGVVILREHDVHKDSEKKALDIMHNLYDYVWNDITANDQQWGTNYKNNTEWTNLFISHNFNIYTKASIFYNFNLNPTMSYFCSYRKNIEHESKK